jgi:hypothetical protein
VRTLVANYSQSGNSDMNARFAASLLAALVAGSACLLVSSNRLLQTAVRAQALQPAQPSTTLVLRGTIAGYDTRSRVLSVRTLDGTVKLPLAEDARIRQGWHRLGASTLKSLSGVRVAVRYFDASRKKIVKSVHVLVKDDNRP